MSFRYTREHSYNPTYSQQLDTVETLREDKETLKSALQSALSTRDELQNSLQDTEERCRALERKNLHLRREYEAAMRTAEDARQELIRLREDQRTIQQLEERTQPLEEVGKPHRYPPSDPSVSEGIEQYAHFILEKLPNHPKLSSLFRERAHSSDRFWARINAQHYDICLFRLLQFLSDILVSTHSKSVSSQTVVETGMNTDLSPKSRWSEGLVTTSSSHEAPRGKGDYERLMGESEQLLNSLYVQSDRLARLNAHVQDTMKVVTRQRSLLLGTY